MLSNKMIDDALLFYDIKDDKYRAKCYEAYEFLNQSKEHKKKFLMLYEILYEKKDYSLAKLWKVKEKKELFKEVYHPYLPNLLLLSGWNIHFKNMKKYNLDDKQVFIHKKRVKESLTYDIYKRKYYGIRISQMLWASYFINLRILEVGSLQYELVDVNSVTNKKERCIKIHIPRDTKLEIKKVKESLIKSKVEIKKYFKIENPKYYCESWLLSKKVLHLLSDGSNILKFSNLFDIKTGNDCTNDILNFVFEKTKCDDYNTLQEDTSLQTKIKEELIKGVIIKIGIGKLKEDIL